MRDHYTNILQGIWWLIGVYVLDLKQFWNAVTNVGLACGIGRILQRFPDYFLTVISFLKILMNTTLCIRTHKWQNLCFGNSVENSEYLKLTWLQLPVQIPCTFRIQERAAQTHHAILSWYFLYILFSIYFQSIAENIAILHFHSVFPPYFIVFVFFKLELYSIVPEIESKLNSSKFNSLFII
jgi:hypothetical protein